VLCKLTLVSGIDRDVGYRTYRGDFIEWPLFQPFSRLAKEADPEERTGMGLVLNKYVVEMMGGTMGAENAVGVGSVFWFELKQASA